MIEPYSVIVQAGPDEILGAPQAGALNLEMLRNWPSIRELTVMLPRLEGADAAAAKLAGWGCRSMIGDPYNVCQRVLEAHRNLAPQDFCVRMLAIWKHMDLEYIDRLVEEMRLTRRDLVAAPKDYDATMAADVSSLDAVRRVSQLKTDGSAEIGRASFNPWGYMESHPDLFSIGHLEPAPSYSPEEVRAILADQRCHPENEFFGRDYSGSRYHHLVELLPSGLRILDIACGSGFGSELLSRKAKFVLGVDYLDSYVRQARDRFPENEHLRFMTGNAETFDRPQGMEPFDLITSLHTLEHVPNDAAMMSSLHRNLRSGGQLIAEVPLLARRPLGVPINPYHLREYTVEQFKDLVTAAGFIVDKMVGACRGFYLQPENARDAMQIWATKP